MFPFLAGDDAGPEIKTNDSMDGVDEYPSPMDEDTSGMTNDVSGTDNRLPVDSVYEDDVDPSSMDEDSSLAVSGPSNDVWQSPGDSHSVDETIRPLSLVNWATTSASSQPPFLENRLTQGLQRRFPLLMKLNCLLPISAQKN